MVSPLTSTLEPGGVNIIALAIEDPASINECRALVAAGCWGWPVIHISRAIATTNGNLIRFESSELVTVPRIHRFFFMKLMMPNQRIRRWVSCLRYRF